MTQNEEALAKFEARVRQLILRFQELEKENTELYQMVEKNEQDIKSLQAKLGQAENDYDSLKMAKMMEITDGDLQGAKDRLSKLIREVNKCISMLQGDEAKPKAAKS
jgi:predicted  nucleic acid-binding Zn-ribbon protein